MPRVPDDHDLAIAAFRHRLVVVTYTPASDVNWVAHRNELAAIPEASSAHGLAANAWYGLSRYNDAVRDRTYISDDDLRGIERYAKRAVDALGVADKQVGRR